MSLNNIKHIFCFFISGTPLITCRCQMSPYRMILIIIMVICMTVMERYKPISRFRADRETKTIKQERWLITEIAAIVNVVSLINNEMHLGYFCIYSVIGYTQNGFHVYQLLRIGSKYSQFFLFRKWRSPIYNLLGIDQID